jgi:hypothetical protein
MRMPRSRSLKSGQFRSGRSVEGLKPDGTTRSMGSVGAAGDIPTMQPFAALLQKNNG